MGFVQGVAIWMGVVLACVSPMVAAAEDVSASETVPTSIGTCNRPDFFFLDVRACPQAISPGEIPHCFYSVLRYQSNHGYRQSSVEEFVASLEPGVPICFRIHGAFVSHEEALRDAPTDYRRIIHTGGHRPLHFVSVHWPSEFNLFPCPPAKLNHLERRADAIGICIAKFLAMIPPENPVCLMGHSLGTRVISQALQALSLGWVHDPVSPATGCRRRIRVVLSAATIDHHWLNPGERFEHTIDRVECLLNITNMLDPALKIYPLNDPLLHQPLGLCGLTCIDRMRLGWQSEKITEKNATLEVRCRHMIPHYYSKPSVMQAAIPYIYFD